MFNDHHFCIILSAFYRKGSNCSEISSHPGEFATINASSPEAVENETIGRNKSSADILTDGSSITDGNEEVGAKTQYDEDDQPVDFSQTTGGGQTTAYKPKFSILSKLKHKHFYLTGNFNFHVKFLVP